MSPLWSNRLFSCWDLGLTGPTLGWWGEWPTHTETRSMKTLYLYYCPVDPANLRDHVYSGISVRTVCSTIHSQATIVTNNKDNNKMISTLSTMDLLINEWNKCRELRKSSYRFLPQYLHLFIDVMFTSNIVASNLRWTCRLSFTQWFSYDVEVLPIHH